MRTQLCGFLALGLGQWARAQSSVVTVYILDRVDRPGSVDYEDVSWGGSVVTEAPTATTYRIEHTPFSGIGENISVITIVNGPSTYANWRVHDTNSTYGEFCAITSAATTYDCNVTYLGAFNRGASGDRTAYTTLETASNTYGEENRTWAPMLVTITDGPELESTPTAPPGEMEAVAAETSGGAAESGESAEDSAGVANSAVGRVALLMAAAVGALVAL